MRFGKIEKNEEIIKFNLGLKCANCNRRVPRGMKSEIKYFETIQFGEELNEFKKQYLCGICRDRKRIQIRN